VRDRAHAIVPVPSEFRHCGLLLVSPDVVLLFMLLLSLLCADSLACWVVCTRETKMQLSHAFFRFYVGAPTALLLRSLRARNHSSECKCSSPSSFAIKNEEIVSATVLRYRLWYKEEIGISTSQDERLPWAASSHYPHHHRIIGRPLPLQAERTR